MKHIRPILLALVPLLAGTAALAQSGPRVVAPGAPGEPGRVLTEPERGPPGAHAEADVRFINDMIVHHAQALVMTALVPERSGRADVRALAGRIDASQYDEIAFMRDWLERRGIEPAPAHEHAQRGHARHDHTEHGHAPVRHDHAGMPGMLSDAQLTQLAAARGEAFDRLFLEYMIHHHEGALVMVAQLFATDGAAQDIELVKFAQHVDADQRIEIERMQTLLEAINR
jgi:uncharacterized protein (DUF305 family)